MVDNSHSIITVKLKKGGWEVEISCEEGQLKRAMESVLSSLPQASAVSPFGEIAPEQSNKTCRGLIVEQWEEGWFSQSRSLSDVDSEISRRGFHYDRTAVSHALADLVREGILTREGPPRNYAYIQKRPPTPTHLLSNLKDNNNDQREKNTNGQS